MKEKFFGDGVEAVGTSPQELGAMVKSEIARIGKIVKDLGITSNE
jgi:tripartite-type tricarboxylate transporter receptor subunit TctC